MSSYDGSRSTLQFEYTVHRSTGWALDEGVPMSPQPSPDAVAVLIEKALYRRPTIRPANILSTFLGIAV